MKFRFFSSVACVLMLTGCSGGGPDCAFSNCGTGTGGPGGGGTATITTDNALPALREAWFAATTTADVPAFVVATGIGDTSGGTVFSPGVNGKMAMRSMLALVPFDETYNCPVSGTFNASGDVTDPNTVTAGDFYIYDASACDSGTGYTVEGIVRTDISNVDGDVASGAYEQTQLLTFDAFNVTNANLNTTFQGDHTGVIDTRNSDATTVSFSGNSLRIDEQNITLTAAAYAGFLSVDNISPFNTTLNVSGSVSSSIIQGGFTYYNEETMQKPIGEAPTDGIFDIDGAGSTARVAIVNQTLVRVQVDANASGNYESSTDMTWDEFLSGNITLNAGTSEFD